MAVRRGRRSGYATVLFGLVAALLAGAAPVGAQDGPVGDAPAPTIGRAVEGDLPGITGTAEGGFGFGETMTITVTLQNAGAPTVVQVPRGTLFASEDEGEQIAVVGGPQAEQAAAVERGVAPELAVPTGTSVHTLTAYCGQRDDSGPMGAVPLHYAGEATEPLPTVLENIVLTGAGATDAQDAVWWVTDDPYVPVDARLRPLLAGVDVDAFAAEPTQAVPDPGYTPAWARDGIGGPFGSGSGGGSVSWVPLIVVLGLLVTFGVVIARSARGSRAVPAHVQHRAGGPPAGWHPDPWQPGRLRWWDGARWSSQTRDR